MSTIADLPYDTGAEIGGRWIQGLRRLPTEDELPDEDGEPMESTWHRVVASILMDSAQHYFQHRNDWWCAANMFLYFNLDMLKNKDFRGPDFFFVKGVAKRSRKSYVVWDEGGHYPNVIIEIASDSTRSNDYGVKKDIYERVFQTPEYFIVEPDRETIRGWRLESGHYREIPAVSGRFRCEQLGLDFGWWEGDYHTADDRYPRFFHSDGRLAPTFHEAERLKAETERQKAEAERQNAKAERQKAELSAKKASEAEALNSELLAELAALKAKLADKPS